VFWVDGDRPYPLKVFSIDIKVGAIAHAADTSTTALEEWGSGIASPRSCKSSRCMALVNDLPEGLSLPGLALQKY
jgi:hypothetical protein